MTKRMILGALDLMSVNFISNAWSSPRSGTRDFASLEYWQQTARILDDGGFDFLFFADVTGYPMHGDDIPEAVIAQAAQTPAHDPLALVSGLAATVDRLSFVVTASTTIERPFMNARRFATLDHLSRGRIGWNIVNSDNQAALVKLLGLGEVSAHGTRYDRADEFIDLCLQLWEGSWEDDAVIYDQAANRYADPSKVHRITHHGTYFDLDGFFTVIPSPQRTPTLFQAGTSDRGKQFAARTAECVFIQDHTLEAVTATVADLRARVVAAGRSARDLKVLNSVSVVVAETEEEAHALRAELTATPSDEAMAAVFLGWTGVDLLALDPDRPLSQRATSYGQSTAERYQDDDGPLVRDIVAGLRETLGGVKITGTPVQVADQLERLVLQGDLDGFLLEPTFGGPQLYRDFIELVMPVLRERGLVDHPSSPTTLRQALFGGDGRLAADHPGAAFRFGPPARPAHPPLDPHTESSETL